MPARRTTFMLAATAVLAAGGPARAQNDAVPMELIRLLMAAGHTMPDIVVGRMPTGFPEGVVPAGARVVGGASGGYGTTAVVAVAQPAREAEAALRQALATAGWTDANRERQQSGFISSSQELPTIFCRGETALNIAALPRDGGGSYLRLAQYSPQQGYSPCEQEQLRPNRGNSHVPALVGPPGARVHGMGTSTSFPEGSESTRGRVTTSMTPAQLLAHYAPQLQQAGWTPSPPVAGPDAGTQTFRTRDPAGKEVFGVLAVVAFPGSEVRELTFSTVPLPLDDAR
jgi:hypothetical protein